MLRLNSDVWLLACHGNNRAPLGESDLRVEVIHHVQKVKENNLIYHFFLLQINREGICVSPSEQQLGRKRAARAVGHQWVSRPYFDLTAQINFSGWEFSFCQHLCVSTAD